MCTVYCVSKFNYLQNKSIVHMSTVFISTVKTVYLYIDRYTYIYVCIINPHTYNIKVTIASKLSTFNWIKWILINRSIFNCQFKLWNAPLWSSRSMTRFNFSSHSFSCRHLTIINESSSFQAEATQVEPTVEEAIMSDAHLETRCWH